MNGNAAAIIIVALIGFAGTVTTALITRPRETPQPQSQPQPEWQPRPTGQWPAGNSGASYAMPTLRVSRSLWWGLAGIFLWLLPILGYIVTLPGLFSAIRDLRSPGTRRYAMIGLALCLLAFVLTLINSAIGAYQGAHGTGWWQTG
jgi:hypothetical protein